MKRKNNTGVLMKLIARLINLFAPITCMYYICVLVVRVCVCVCVIRNIKETFIYVSLHPNDDSNTNK